MDKIEKIASEQLNWWVNPQGNAKASEQPDAIDNHNQLHQIGSNGKTLANNYNRTLTGNKIHDFKMLWNDDVSDFLTLYINHKKDGEQFISFNDYDVVELFSDNPDLLYYDYDSRTKKKTLRIKVLKTKIRLYQYYATEIHRL